MKTLKTSIDLAMEKTETHRETGTILKHTRRISGGGILPGGVSDDYVIATLTLGEIVVTDFGNNPNISLDFRKDNHGLQVELWFKLPRHLLKPGNLPWKIAPVIQL
jgi:hypothetical protein